MMSEKSRHFFPDHLKKTVDDLTASLNDNGQARIYTDATVKKNNLPNGFALIAPRERAILLPLLLRDPGCGFLTFKIKGLNQKNANWQETVGSALAVFVNETLLSGKVRDEIIKKIDLKEAIFEGLAPMLSEIEHPERFRDIQFSVDRQAVKPSEEEYSALLKDLLNVTNTLEIRKAASVAYSDFSDNETIEQDDLIGFIHTGCDLFAQLLGQRFVYNIAKFADENGLFSVDNIRQGKFGVPLNTPLGYQYYQWLQSAMNYALLNRYLIYQAVQSFLHNQFDCETTLINDVAHAGIFSTKNKGVDCVVSTRGVQPLSYESQPSFAKSLRLVAGQVNSIALLVSADKQAENYDNLIQHGTSYEIADDPQLTQHYFSQETVNSYLNAAKTTFCNASYDTEYYLDYAFNTLITQDYYAQIGLAKSLAVLLPAINIHGTQYMKKN